MLSPKTLVLLLILGYPATWAQKGKVPVSPISKIKSVDKFDMNKFSGKWFLLSVASQCSYLKTNNHRVEATFIQISSEKNIKRKEFLSMSTFRKMDGICWEIKNAYYPNEANKIKGRFILKGKGYAKDVEMVVGDTDYENYAILYYQKSRKISMKLYGRKTELPNSVYEKFDALVTKQGMALEDTYSFPIYGFCETTSVDRFHILNEIPT